PRLERRPVEAPDAADLLGGHLALLGEVREGARVEAQEGRRLAQPEQLRLVRTRPARATLLPIHRVPDPFNLSATGSPLPDRPARESRQLPVTALALGATGFCWYFVRCAPAEASRHRSRTRIPTAFG